MFTFGFAFDLFYLEDSNHFMSINDSILSKLKVENENE